MRSFNTMVFLSFSLLLIFPAVSYAQQQNPYEISYPFDSAIIRYSGSIEQGSHSGDMRGSKGTEIIYIKGDRTLKKTMILVPDSDGELRTMETLRLITPEYVYMVNLSDNKGFKIDNPKKYGKEAYQQLSEEDKNEFHARMDKRGIISLDLLGLGRKIGSEKFLGKECDVYENGKELTKEDLKMSAETGQSPYYMKTWVWRDAKIPLKIVTETIDSNRELVATKIELNADIPDSRFEIPEDVKVTYDEQRSINSKRETLARFNLYKTGQPKVMKYKAEKEVRTSEGDWVKEKDAKKEEKPVQDQGRKKSGLLDLLTGLSLN